MRVYISNYKKELPTTTNPVESYFYTVHHIWTSDGLLLQIENNRIYRMKLDNKSEIKTMLGIYPVTIKGEYIKEGECFQIPPHSRQEILVYKIYKISPIPGVEWVFVYKDNILQDNYFSMPDGMDIRKDLGLGLGLGAAAPTTPLPVGRTH